MSSTSAAEYWTKFRIASISLALVSTNTNKVVANLATHAGHSLGGALATLAAYDIRKQLLEQNKRSVEVVCYSFGAPRTGNHNFAKDYNHMVPDTWSIINDQVPPDFSAVPVLSVRAVDDDRVVLGRAIIKSM